MFFFYFPQNSFILAREKDPSNSRIAKILNEKSTDDEVKQDKLDNEKDVEQSNVVSPSFLSPHNYSSKFRSKDEEM